MLLTAKRAATAFLLSTTPCWAQPAVPGVDPKVVARIREEVATPITSAFPGWLTGDDPGPASIECWDSKDARRLRATLMYVPVGKSAGATIERMQDSLKLVPGAKVLGDDNLSRRVLSDSYAEAITLVEMPGGSHTLYIQRAVAFGDDLFPPILLATFRSAKGQNLDDFKISVASRIRGLDPGFDTFLSLGLRRDVRWEGDGSVTITRGDRQWTFVAPKGWKRSTTASALAEWQTDRAVARVRPMLGSEKDAAAFATRWLAEPCIEGEIDNTPRVLPGASDAKKAEYVYLALPQKAVAEGRLHHVQIRGAAPLFFVYDISLQVTGAESRDQKPTALDSAIKAALAATKEGPVKKPEAPAKKKK